MDDIRKTAIDRFRAYLDRIGKCIFPVSEVPITQG